MNRHANQRSASTFLQLIRRSERGRLKLYLGYAPGVGKTYLMLQEAHRLKQEGIDVVVGFVETHGRKETAQLLDGLESVPRKRVEYRQVALEEMDVEAILSRRPQVALVDELAHTNPPGSRNVKRYEDVEDLLAAGIHVISTMNVQHLESLYNTVEGLVQVRVAERVPDVILKETDEIVNVDVSPTDLVKRLQSGRIYPVERVALASQNYFRPGNLEQLRELTLRETATQIDFKRREQAETGEHVPPDQIMVCLSASGPNNAHLLRYGSRLAGRLNRRWYAVHVQSPQQEALKIDAAKQRMLSETMTLANQLGAMVFTFKGTDVVNTILRFARDYRVGHIVIGRSRPLRWWKRLVRQRNNVERLIDQGSGFRIVVLDERLADRDLAAPAPPAAESPRQPVAGLAAQLSAAAILIWREPISKEQALSELMDALRKCYPREDLSAGLSAVRAREAEISTFLNEGVALPHARIDSLSRVCVALGVPQAGFTDLDEATSVDAVLMSLYPTAQSDRYLRIMADSAALFRDRSLRRAIQSAENVDAVLALLNTPA